MKKITTLFIIIFPFIVFTQTQIGSDIDGEAADDGSGSATSISSDGSIIAVGAFGNDGVNGSATGHVRIYQNQSGAWVQQGLDIEGESTGDSSGGSISLSTDGSIVAVGALGNDGVNGINSGHVKVYQNQSGNWVQLGQDIDGEAPDDRSGRVSISADGYTIAIGARLNGNDKGHVRVYKYNNVDSWIQVGQDIDGITDFDQFGFSLSLSGDATTLAVGAPRSFSTRGSVRVFRNISGNWTLIDNALIGDQSSDEFGFDVSLSENGETLAVGARLHDGAGFNNSGQVKVFQLNAADTWVQVGSNIYGDETNAFFGFKVSLSANGDILTAGAPTHQGESTLRGVVRIYQNLFGVWTKIGNDINGENDFDRLPDALSLSGDGSTLVTGSRLNTGINGVNSGHTRVYDLTDIVCFENINPVVNPIPSDNAVNVILGETNNSLSFNWENDTGNSGTSFILNLGTNISANDFSFPDFNSGNGLTNLAFDTTYFWRVDVLNNCSEITTGTTWSFTTGSCTLTIPNQVISPTPTDGATNVVLGDLDAVNFSWLDGTGDLGATFTLNFGTTMALDVSVTNFVNGDPIIFFANNTTYFWRIDVTNCAGTTIGNVWSFTTGEACTVTAPNQVINPTPADGATNVSLSGMFNELNFLWENGTGEAGTSFTLNFGTTDVNEFTFNDFLSGDSLPGLQNNTSYLWRIDAINCSGTTIGDVWSFTTGETLSIDDNEIEQIKVYPNPTSNILNIELNQSTGLERVNIYNNLGQLAHSEKNSKIDVSGLSNGIYFVEIITDIGKASRKLVIK